MDANMQFTINSYRQLFPDKIFSLTIPWLSVKSLTFPWQLSNSLIFPGLPDKWSPCRGRLKWLYSVWQVFGTNLQNAPENVCGHKSLRFSTTRKIHTINGLTLNSTTKLQLISW